MGYLQITLDYVAGRKHPIMPVRQKYIIILPIDLYKIMQVVNLILI
jgi:hypothetical protein